jgi:hypothetical protein
MFAIGVLKCGIGSMIVHGFQGPDLIPEVLKIFMRSMISNYATEGANEDGVKNGTFWMSEGTTEAAAQEVLLARKGLKGDDLKKYLDTYFAKAWAHFDVNKRGQVEVIQMPQFMRFLARDQTMSL